MARIAEKVRDLVSGDPEMRAAVESVLEYEGEVVEWRDVNGDLTSGQWGRLIETGVLVESGDGFRFSDADAVRDGLTDRDESSYGSTADASGDDDGDDAGWTTYDKVAGLCALAMMTGYYYHPVRNTVGPIMDIVFGPLRSLLPFFVVVMIISVLTGFWTSIIQANLMNFDDMSEYQERLNEIQEREKAAKERDDEEALERIQDEKMDAMGDQMGMMKMQFRPMAWIMLVTIPVFLWMYWTLLSGQMNTSQVSFVLPLIGKTHLLSRVGGFFPAWIVWYFLCSMGFSQVVRKSLGIQTSPT